MLNEISRFNKIKCLLSDDLFASKDWEFSATVGRVQWLLDMYDSVKNERDDYLDRVIALEDKLTGIFETQAGSSL